MLDASQIDEIRRLVRLEALRSAVFSVASESLDQYHTAMVVSCSLEGDSLEASIQFRDAMGNVLLGGSL